MAYAERRNSKLTGRWICDAEYNTLTGPSPVGTKPSLARARPVGPMLGVNNGAAIIN